MPGLTLILTLLLQSEAALPQPEAKKDVDVEQLAVPGGHVRDMDIPNVASGKGADPSQISQLPPTLDAPVGASKGEDVLKGGDQHDRRRFADEVARVAGTLRERGQQPTPEALAREIGPDTLAQYLSVDPAMLDSYGAIPERGDPVPVPDGGAIAIPVPPQ